MPRHPRARLVRPHVTVRRALAWTLALAGLLVAGAAAAGDLEALADRLAQRFNGIAHVEPATVAAWRERGQDMILLDTRSPEEYAVGHIPGAVRVPPGAGADTVIARLDRPLEGAVVVAYCSVGQRSSTLAQRVREPLRRAGAERVVNLRGGVFAWHNAGRPLADAGGRTEWVHPYSDHWAGYLERRGYTAYEPRD